MTFVKARFCVFCAAILGALVVAGCAPPAQMEATTTIRADGAWTRALTFGVPVGDRRAAAAARLKPAAQRRQSDRQRQAARDRLRATFVLPASGTLGARVTTTNARQKPDADFIYYAAQRTAALAPGDTLRGDVSLLRPAATTAQNAAPVVVNEASVQPRGSGRVEYRETLRWRGAALPTELLRSDPALDAALAAHLPAAVLASGANDPAGAAARRAVALRVQRRLWHVAFGPGHSGRGPALFAPAGLTQQTYVREQTRAALGDALEAEFPGRLLASERRETARNVARALFAPKLTPASGAGNGHEQTAATVHDSGGAAPWAALTFTLKAPGRVLETNGRYNARRGTVTWTLYAAAPAAGPIVLSALCEVPEPSRSGPRVAAAPPSLVR